MGSLDPKVLLVLVPVIDPLYSSAYSFQGARLGVQGPRQLMPIARFAWLTSYLKLRDALISCVVTETRTCSLSADSARLCSDSSTRQAISMAVVCVLGMALVSMATAAEVEIKAVLRPHGHDELERAFW